MRWIGKWILFPMVAIAAGCTIQQQNGNDLRVKSPPLLAGNHWQITQQSVTQDGDRVCTVSAGEMDVTQHLRGKTITPQVALSYPLNPGDRYRIIMGDHVYETPEGQGWFSAAESQTIIQDFWTADVVYTEVQQRVIQPGSEYQRAGNKINLSGLGEQFKACERFVTGRAR